MTILDIIKSKKTLAIVCFIVTFVVAFSFHSSSNFWSSVLPAWVQAIGSILAIYWSGRTALKQLKHEKTIKLIEELNSQDRKIKVLTAHVISIDLFARQIREGFNEKDKAKLLKSKPIFIEKFIKLIDELPIYDSPDVLLDFYFRTIGASLTHLSDIYPQYYELLKQPDLCFKAENYRPVDEWIPVIIQECDGFKKQSAEVRQSVLTSLSKLEEKW